MKSRAASGARKVVFGALALVVVIVAGFLVWFYVIRDDAPSRLSSADLDDALAVATIPADQTVPPVAGTPDGTWQLVADDSTVGYRVVEVLAGLETEGAGRTSAVTGALEISGARAIAGNFEVDMTAVSSNSDRRDEQFHGRIMDTRQFPTAAFVLAQPIDFGVVPAEGETIHATAIGNLTLRGTTRAVTFEVEAKLANDRIGVLGQIPITFADYGIPNPTNTFAKTENHGILEFVLVFDR